MKNILITRNPIKSKRLASFLKKSEHNIFFQPLFSVKKNFLKNNIHKLENRKINNVIITSSNAIYLLKKLEIKKEAKIFTVGKVTASKIQKLGYKNIFYPEKPSAKNLPKIIFDNISKPHEIYYFRGEKISYDIANEMKNLQLKITELIAYKTQKIENFSDNIIEFFRQKKIDEILIFSKNSLEIFIELCIKHNLVEYLNYLSILCFSEDIAFSAKNKSQEKILNQKINFKNVQVFCDNPLLNKFYDRDSK